MPVILSGEVGRRRRMTEESKDLYMGNALSSCRPERAAPVRQNGRREPRACEALAMLDRVTQLPGHSFWPMEVAFLDAVAPFAERLFGHQQVSDAYLLGMAIRKKGRLVTLDRAIETLAGSEFRNAVVVLE